MSRCRAALVACLSVVVLGAGLAAVPEPASAATGVAYRCVVDAFDRTADGRLRLRKLVNDRVTRTLVTDQTYPWTPISWSLVSSNSWPGYEKTGQMVASTDGKLRYVETEWWAGSDRLRVTVGRELVAGLPSRRVAVFGNTMYWAESDGSLWRARWTGKSVTRPHALGVRVPRARAIAVIESRRGVRVYVTDAAGALHAVADDYGGVTTHVLSTRGFAGVTAMKAGACHSSDYARMRGFAGLVTVDRRTGVARFRRHLRPDRDGGGALTPSVRVRGGGAPWRSLG